jgi:hypothetical protein
MTNVARKHIEQAVEALTWILPLIRLVVAIAPALTMGL